MLHYTLHKYQSQNKQRKMSLIEKLNIIYDAAVNQQVLLFSVTPIYSRTP